MLVDGSDTGRLATVRGHSRPCRYQRLGSGRAFNGAVPKCREPFTSQFVPPQSLAHGIFQLARAIAGRPKKTTGDPARSLYPSPTVRLNFTIFPFTGLPVTTLMRCAPQRSSARRRSSKYSARL